MPPKKKFYRKKRGKKAPRKKNYRRRAPRNQNIQRQLVVADRTFVKLKYLEVDPTRTSITIPANQNVAIFTYRANDLKQHIPNVTTNLPGFDGWASFYSRYRVHAVKVKVSLVSNDSASQGTTNKPLIGFIHCQSDPAPANFTDWDNIRRLEGNRYSVYKPLAITEQGGQTTTTRLSRYYKFSAVNGNALQFRSDTTFEGTTGQPGNATPLGPGRVFNYYVGIMTMDRGAVAQNAQTVSVMLTTKFYVEFKDRYDVAA